MCERRHVSAVCCCSWIFLTACLCSSLALLNAAPSSAGDRCMKLLSCCLIIAWIWAARCVSPVTEAEIGNCCTVS